MLATIIANYLQLPESQAKKLIELFSLEQRWNETAIWKDQKINPAEINTQDDLINFMQAIGQSNWFKGHDRSKFANNLSDVEINAAYYALFTGMGLTQAIEYDKSFTIPEFSVVLGSSELQVDKRVKTLKCDLLAGLAPAETKVFGLGCNRELGVSVIETESASKAKLQAQGLATTEMNMVSLLSQEVLESLKATTTKALTYQPINTTSAAKSREEKTCVKTTDTASSLKEAIETQYDITKKEKPIAIAVYSNQPFVLRQQRDVQQKLGTNYKAIGVGKELTEEEFNLHPKSISICLGEIARLININYTPQNIKKIALTAAEKEEVKQLRETSLLKKNADEKAAQAVNLAGHKSILLFQQAKNGDLTAGVPKTTVLKFNS